ncbi:hypothetical protein [Priestia megaterium]|uniref:hypothetical protein n=1 Tax=Priestia megaterium TaxID=1404 RepID=UPI000CA11A14|nr:hypothetical protein [Priestia megaterium]AUO12206.1 hypothetical protein C0569_13185 [Priestia megaterium]
MTPGKNGLFALKTIEKSGLPIYNFVIDETTGIPITYCSYTDLKKYGFKLNDKQRQIMTKGFIKTSNRMKGYAALYDLCEVIEIFCGYKPTYISSN